MFARGLPRRVEPEIRFKETIMENTFQAGKPRLSTRQYQNLAELEYNLLHKHNGKELSVDTNKMTASFTIDRYEMDSNGFHVGDETYLVTFEIVKEDYPNDRQGSPLAPYLARVDNFDIDLIDHPEEYGSDDPDFFEGYSAPSSNEAWDIMEYEVREILANQPYRYCFNPDSLEWEFSSWDELPQAIQEKYSEYFDSRDSE